MGIPGALDARNALHSAGPWLPHPLTAACTSTRPMHRTSPHPATLASSTAPASTCRARRISTRPLRVARCPRLGSTHSMAPTRSPPSTSRTRRARSHSSLSMTWLEPQSPGSRPRGSWTTRAGWLVGIPPPPSSRSPALTIAPKVHHLHRRQRLPPGSAPHGGRQDVALRGGAPRGESWVACCLALCLSSRCSQDIHLPLYIRGPGVPKHVTIPHLVANSAPLAGG